MTTCAREGCGHDRVMHPRAGHCRQPACSCQAYVVPEPEPEVDEGHRHQWQAAGVLRDRVGDIEHAHSIAALCPCGAVIRLRVPDEAANA